MFQIGDIVKDISEDVGVHQAIGVIVDAVVIFEKPVFHVKFFDYDYEVIPLQAHEIQKVS